MLTSELPKLRGDLHFSRQETAGEGVFVLKDPATGRFFRFREAEHFIAGQPDGSTPTEVIQRRVEEKFGTPVDSGTLAQFIEHFRRLGLLDGQGATPGPQTERRRRVRGNLLYLRLPAFDPDHLLKRLLPAVRFCFTRPFLVLTSLLILLALGVAHAGWSAIGREIPHFYRPETLVLAWLAILLVTTAHEFAHGLTCKHFGGEVREMGFLLIYFQPAFYCNVSDAWLFPETSKRLWVTFAGAYCELVLWALATLIWRVTEPETGLHFLALVVMATSLIKSFFNLNPLIKLDGYYLLSDYLEIPNLRQRAFRYLAARIKRWWGAGPSGLQEATPRERRIYLVYGLLAGAYSYWLLGVVALYFGRYLVERYQGSGFILFTLLLMAVFQNPLRAAAQKVTHTFRFGQGRMAAMRRPAKGLLLLTAILPVLFLGRMGLTVSGEFEVLPIHNADIRAEVEGLIQEMYVDEGSLVKEGDLIARLSDRDFSSELRQLGAQLAEKRAKLKLLVAGPRREEIELARKAVETAQTRQEQARKHLEEAQRMRVERLAKSKSTVAKAEERLKYAKNYLAIYQDLFNDRAVSRKQIEEAEEEVSVRAKGLEEAQADSNLVLADDLSEAQREVAVAAKELEEARSKLRVLLAGSRPEEIEACEAEIARFEAGRRYMEEQLQRVRVTSPISGIVTTPKAKEKVGQLVKKGDLIVEVHELKTVTAEIAVSEKDVGDVQVGQKVVLKARAHPEERFVGAVTTIAPAAVKNEEEAWRGKIFKVTADIDNPGLLLRSEMTGNAKIFSGQRRIFDLMTRKLARYIRLEFWSWW
jgi:putative peptide zinc metalloprotease protein